jgi:hypothetical protein
MSRTKFKLKQGFSGFAPDKIFLKEETIKKRGKIESWFFDNALRLNAFYHCVQMKQIFSKGFHVMLRARLF